MGTPEFAIPSLDLIRQKHELVCVITAPDKPAGRGHHLHESAVKKYSVDHNVFLLQPRNLKSTRFQTIIKELNADLSVVVAFRKLPESLIQLPRLGSINLHGSLLPKYRGAAPIQRAIMNGERITGLTVFKLSASIDSGDILQSTSIEIGPDETGGELHDKMSILGAQLLEDCLNLMKTDSVHFTAQDNSLSSPAPKIFKEDCLINWEESVHTVYNLIRALIPYPCAWFIKADKQYKIHKAKKVEKAHSLSQGSWAISNGSLQIACLGGFIQVLEIQAEGRRKMPVSDFLNGLSATDIKNLE